MIIPNEGETMDRYHNLEVPGNPKIRIVLSAYLNKGPRIVNAAFCCVHSLLAQTYENFEIYIHHDGPLEDRTLAQKFRDLDQRITFLDDLPHLGLWGFPHRHPTALLEPQADYCMWTNEDNYYTPDFLKIMLHTAIKQNSGMIFCNMIHSHYGWRVFNTRIAVGGIDMGAFIARMDLVRGTPWTDFNPCADGYYAEKIAAKTNPVKVDNFLFVHN